MSEEKLDEILQSESDNDSIYDLSHIDEWQIEE